MEAAYPALERFVEVLEVVRQRHPDLDKVTYDRLINEALDGMLSSLAPHSSFIHPEMKQLMDQKGVLDNEIRSLGLSIAKNSESLFVSAVEKNGPADLAGFIPGITILKINDEPPQDIPLKSALEALRRQVGGSTKLTLTNPERPGETEVSLVHRFVADR